MQGFLIFLGSWGACVGCVGFQVAAVAVGWSSGEDARRFRAVDFMACDWDGMTLHYQ